MVKEYSMVGAYGFVPPEEPPRRTAEAELRRHVRERHRRASVRAQDMEAAMALVRDDTGMSSETWIESLALMRGVGPVDDADRARFWAMVEVLYCGWNDEAPACQREELVLVTVRGANVYQEIACAVTLHEAAHRVGVGPRLANRWWSDAVAAVKANQKPLESREARG